MFILNLMWFKVFIRFSLPFSWVLFHLITLVRIQRLITCTSQLVLILIGFAIQIVPLIMHFTYRCFIFIPILYHNWFINLNFISPFITSWILCHHGTTSCDFFHFRIFAPIKIYLFGSKNILNIVEITQLRLRTSWIKFGLYLCLLSGLLRHLTSAI